MELQADVGDRAGAISTFHKCAEILDQELQAKPSQATETFAERLLSSDGPEIPPARGNRLVRRDREFDQVLESWTASSTAGLDCWS
jgi:DNA-binding SARP family transcriptional activator